VILTNTSFVAESTPFQEQHKSSHEDILAAEPDHSLSIPLDSALQPSPEPRVLEKEEIQTPELHLKFEDDPFEGFENTSNYVCKRRPSVPVASTYPIEAAFCRENVKKSMATMSSEWLREMKLSSKVLWISCPPSTLSCTIKGTQVDTLYSPTVGANIISSECAFRHLRDEPLVQTDKTFQTSFGEILEACGTLQNVSIRHEDVEIILDFHMFDVQDFDLLIGQSIEKFLTDAPTQNKLEVHQGKETIYVQIARATNSMTEPSLDFEPIKEVKGILLVDSPESPYEKYA